MKTLFPVPLLPWWIRWGGVIGVAGFLFYVSVITVPPETVIDEVRFELIPLDKWRHFVAYGVLGYALAYATTDWDLPSIHIVFIVFGVTVTYGVGIEYSQSLVPERYFSLTDAYANGLGGVMAMSYYLFARQVTFVSLQRFASILNSRLTAD